MRMWIKCYICSILFVLAVLSVAGCNRTVETGNQGTPAPTVTLSPTSEPTLTPAPTATPIPTREDILAKSWFDEYKIVDCEEYYFEMLSFKEREVGGYAMEVVFENRQPFAVYVGISDVYINFLRHPLDVWPVNWGGRMIGPGKRETIEFEVPDYYVEQLGIETVEEFNCVDFTLSVWAVADIYFDYSDYQRIMFYRYGREKVIPYRHVLEEDDIVLYDRDDVKLYLTDFIQVENGYYRVNFYWENNTTHALYFEFFNESLNGYMCSSFGLDDVSISQGIGAYDYFMFDASELMDNGITTITEIEFDVSLYYDAGIWQWTDYVADTFCVYPLGVDEVQKQNRKPQDTDIVVFETDDYKMVITGFSQTSQRVLDSVYRDYIFYVYFENRTDHDVQFVANEVKMDGEEYKDYYNYHSVDAGKNMYTDLSWELRDKEIENYPNLENLELSVQIKNMDDEKQSVIFEESFTVIP